MTSRSLAEVLKACRKKAGFTQDSLAAASGCTRSLIAGIESGSGTSKASLTRIIGALPEGIADEIRALDACREILADENSEPRTGLLADGETEDVIERLMSRRRTKDADITGVWNAMWRTTTRGEENRNREIVDIGKRWNGSWQFVNRAVSDDNPDGGYMWIGRMELFDNKNLLGHYCARTPATLAKGVMCLELQTNGREILGVWDGLNFDTMWASGMVALSLQEDGARDPADLLDDFIKLRPQMPY